VLEVAHENDDHRCPLNCFTTRPLSSRREPYILTSQIKDPLSQYADARFVDIAASHRGFTRQTLHQALDECSPGDSTSTRVRRDDRAQQLRTRASMDLTVSDPGEQPRRP